LAPHQRSSLRALYERVSSRKIDESARRRQLNFPRVPRVIARDSDSKLEEKPDSGIIVRNPALDRSLASHRVIYYRAEPETFVVTRHYRPRLNVTANEGMRKSRGASGIARRAFSSLVALSHSSPTRAGISRDDARNGN